MVFILAPFVKLLLVHTSVLPQKQHGSLHTENWNDVLQCFDDDTTIVVFAASSHVCTCMYKYIYVYVHEC